MKRKREGGRRGGEEKEEEGPKFYPKNPWKTKSTREHPRFHNTVI